MTDDFYNKLVDYRNRMRVALDQNIRILEIREGLARGEMTVTELQQNLLGTVHGGVLMTFADITASVSAWSYGIYTTTMNCSVNFLNPAANVDRLWAEAQVEKRGRQTVVSRVVVTDPEEKVILTSSFTLYSLDRPIELD